MTEKEKFKQEILTAILPEILEYVDNAARAFEAKNEPSWFDKIEETVQMAKDSMSVDKFYKGVSTHSTLHSMITEAVVKAEINKAKEATAPTPPQSAQMGWTGLEPPHPMNIAEFNRVKRWSPKFGEWYWSFRGTGEPMNYKCIDSREDDFRIKWGNCFATKQQAESARDKVKELLLNIQH
jgi:hypothetical protein